MFLGIAERVNVSHRHRNCVVNALSIVERQQERLRLGGIAFQGFVVINGVSAIAVVDERACDGGGPSETAAIRV